MNDPNGLVYFNGTYNLYFQYNPTGNVAGDQNWGHATSTDLIHWKNASPFIAIPSDPANNDFIYSGSAVVDFNNSSGFFNTAPGKEGLVANLHSGDLSGEAATGDRLQPGRRGYLHKVRRESRP